MVFWRLRSKGFYDGTYFLQQYGSQQMFRFPRPARNMWREYHIFQPVQTLIQLLFRCRKGLRFLIFKHIQAGPADLSRLQCRHHVGRMDAGSTRRIHQDERFPATGDEIRIHQMSRFGRQRQVQADDIGFFTQRRKSKGGWKHAIS